MSLLDFFVSYFWLICLVACLVQYIIASAVINLRQGGDRASLKVVQISLCRFVVFLSAPWFVMGFGQAYGGANVWQYLRPQDLNPYVILFFGVIFVETVLFAIWVCFRDGVAEIVKFLALGFGLNVDRMLAGVYIKIVAVLSPFFVVLCVIYVVAIDAPVAG